MTEWGTVPLQNLWETLCVPIQTPACLLLGSWEALIQMGDERARAENVESSEQDQGPENEPEVSKLLVFLVAGVGGFLVAVLKNSRLVSPRNQTTP